MRGVADALRWVALTATLTILFALINPVPAAAHVVGTGGSPTNYRTRVTAIRPVVPAVAVTVGLGGQWVRVTDRGAATIVILGYRGEPFLRLSRNRVQINQLSATAAQTGLTFGTPVPGHPVAGTRWVHVSDGDSVAWTDARVSPPPDSVPASGSWELRLVVDGQQVTALGTREWIPPPSPWPWVAVLVLLIAAVAAIGRRRNWHRPMAYVVAAVILAFVLHVLGTGFAPQQSGPVVGWFSVVLVAGFSVVIGTVGLVSTVRRSESAPDRLVVLGAMVLLLAAADLTGLWNSQLPFPGPAVLDRALTVVTYGIALGLIVAGVHLVRVA
ncbi:MAG: hypothetical protein WBL53_04880, partial [Pseudonocardiaceae bacterium]